jgi:DNA-binding transcriptional MerR regulator
MPGSLKLEELAQRAGVSARTVRYYIQRGLLPAPEFRGPDTSYREHHLLVLKAIRGLQDAHLPLDAIAGELRGKSADELRAIASRKASPQLQVQLQPARSAAASVDDSPDARPLTIGGTPRHGTRFELATGLELWLSDDASDATREFADALRELAAKRSTHKGRG